MDPSAPPSDRDITLEARIRMKLTRKERLNDEEKGYFARLPGETRVEDTPRIEHQ